MLSVGNGVLNYTKDKLATNANTQLVITLDELKRILTGEISLEDAEYTLTGSSQDFKDFLGLLDKKEDTPFWFNIVLP